MKKLILVVVVILGSLVSSQAQTKADFARVYSQMIKGKFPNSYVTNGSGDHVNLYLSSIDFANQGSTMNVASLERELKDESTKDAFGDILASSFKQGLGTASAGIKDLGINKIYLYVTYMDNTTDLLTIIYL
jgi:hypothetical protein